jgi:hypothetical protein
MFLPWIGLFEQMRLADTFVHYDDVQLPQGRSFMSRVQVKTATGVNWLTAPIDRNRSGRLISETFLLADREWRRVHLQTLKHCYGKAPYFRQMFELAGEIYGHTEDNLARFNRNALERIAAFLGLSPRFCASSELGIGGASTERLLALCVHFRANNYITGLGALDYLDYSEFESAGIVVRYMAYQKRRYEQSHGEFTPYVTIFDAIAHCGRQTSDLLRSESVYWKDYVEEPR